MNKSKLLKTLKNLGLSDNEAHVYLASLGLGPTSIKKIAEQSGVKRTSVYNIVEDLRQLGLMHIDMSGLKHKFVAEEPGVLHEMIERKREELAGSMPEFKKVYDTSAKKDRITFIEGEKGMRAAYEQLPEGLKRGDPYYIVTNTSKWHKVNSDFAVSFIEKRARRGFDIRMLTQGRELDQELLRYQRNIGIKTKLLPDTTELNTNMVITPKQVLIQQLSFPIVALRIENKSIIDMHQQLFKIMWDAIPQ